MPAPDALPAPPAGVSVALLDDGSARVSLQYSAFARVALVFARTLLIGALAFLTIELWLHAHVLFVFLSLPLLLAGPSAVELLLSHDFLAVTPQGGLFAGPSEL